MNDYLNSTSVDTLITVSQENFIRLPVVIDSIKTELEAVTLSNKISEKYDINNIFNTIKDKNQQKHLGCEYNSCIVIADKNTPVNLLCALFGTIKGGSLIFFIYVESKEDNLFLEDYFIPKLKKCENRFSQQASKDYPKQTSIVNAKDSKTKKTSHTASKSLTKTSNEQRVTHIIGQRGRGKSTLLGEIASLLLKKGKRIICTAPSKKAAYNLIDKNKDVSRETFHFLPPEKILSKISNYDVLIIDEAASLPFGTVNNALQKAKDSDISVYLATTIEGYESKGQSYRLEYIENDASSSIKVIELKIPFRFSELDPIEKIISDLCFQNILKKTDLNHSDGVFTYGNKEMVKLGLLFPCYKLLAEAHYKTTPNDLANFYNNKNLVFSVVIELNMVISACVSVDEECEDKSIAEDIFNGTRRPKGALSIQSLINSYGILEIINHKYLRIIRIATDKNYRRNKNATKLISKTIQIAKQRRYEAVTTSFSAIQKNILFWEAQGFLAVRVGFNQNKYNGCHPILMLKDTSDSKPTKEIFDKINQEFGLFWQLHKAKDEEGNAQFNFYLNNIINKEL